MAEILDDHAEQDHSKLFLGQFTGLSRHEDELEELGPLFVRDQNLTQVADHVRNVLLHQGYWLILEL